MAPLSYLSSPLLPLLEMVAMMAILFFLYVQVGPPPISSSGRLLREERRKGRRKARDVIVWWSGQSTKAREEAHGGGNTHTHTSPSSSSSSRSLTFLFPPSITADGARGGGQGRRLPTGWMTQMPTASPHLHLIPPLSCMSPHRSVHSKA